MSAALHIVALCSLTLWLSACGFEPVYRQQQGRLDVADSLSFIAIKAPSSRNGDQLTAELEDLFFQSQKPRDPLYQLQTDIDIEQRPFIVDKDGISSRYDLILTSHYQLTRIADQKQLDKGQIRRYVSYNVSDANDYATYISQKDATKRGVRALAEDYQQQIAAKLSRATAAP